jgi:hypothetical protein
MDVISVFNLLPFFRLADTFSGIARNSLEKFQSSCLPVAKRFRRKPGNVFTNKKGVHCRGSFENLLVNSKAFSVSGLKIYMYNKYIFKGPDKNFF